MTGKYLDGRQDNKLADRDAMYRHYIQLHPEDFPSFGKNYNIFS